MLSLSIFRSANSLLVWRNATRFDSNKGLMNVSNIFGFLFLFAQTFKVKVLWSGVRYMIDGSFILNELTATVVFTVHVLHVRKTFSLSLFTAYHWNLNGSPHIYSDEGVNGRYEETTEQAFKPSNNLLLFPFIAFSLNRWVVSCML